MSPDNEERRPRAGSGAQDGSEPSSPILPPAAPAESPELADPDRCADEPTMSIELIGYHVWEWTQRKHELTDEELKELEMLAFFLGEDILCAQSFRAGDHDDRCHCFQQLEYELKPPAGAP